MDSNEKKIKATGDLAFKKVFGMESAGTKKIVTGLIKDFFDITPKEVTIVNPYDIRAYTNLSKKVSEKNIKILRETLADVRAKLEVGDFIAEMQVIKTTSFEPRSIYYLCSRFTDNYMPGSEKYKSLCPIYSLNILDYKYFDDETAVRTFKLLDVKTHEPLKTDYLTIMYFELCKNEVYNKHQEYWLKYFRGDELPEDAPEYIKEAEEVIRIANLGKEEIDVLDYLEKHDADKEGQIEAAVQDRNIEVAKAMKENGAEISFIVRCTGLSEEEVAAL